MPAKSLELKHTIKLIQEFDKEISEIEEAIQVIMDKINSPITSIPGIGTTMAAMIIAEIGDFDNFDSPDKILAFAGLSPSTYLVSSITAMRTWKSVAPVIFAMRYLMQPDMSATGIPYLPIISQKSVPKASITMLPFLTPLKSWYGSFLLYRNQVNHI